MKGIKITVATKLKTSLVISENTDEFIIIIILTNETITIIEILIVFLIILLLLLINAFMILVTNSIVKPHKGFNNKFLNIYKMIVGIERIKNIIVSAMIAILELNFL